MDVVKLTREVLCQVKPRTVLLLHKVAQRCDFVPQASMNRWKKVCKAPALLALFDAFSHWSSKFQSVEVG